MERVQHSLKSHRWQTIVAGVLVAIWSLPAMAADEAADKTAAQKENPHVWKPRVKSVAVFKEDLGFFMREGEVSLRDGWCVSKQIPPAIFGTLAIFSHDQGRLVPPRQHLTGVLHLSRTGVIRADGHEEWPHCRPGLIFNVRKRRFVGGHDFFADLLGVRHPAQYGLPDLHVGMGLGIVAPGQESLAGPALARR